MKPAYFIPSRDVLSEEEIKKSRFITLLCHTPSVEAAKLRIEAIKLQHPSARHHCWAFVAGAPDDSQVLGFSDDGEPSGTAGKPILAQLQGSGLGEITAIVVRYSGGIKLGTGGLVKAYGGGVKQALALIETSPYYPKVDISVVVSFAHMADIEHLESWPEVSIIDRQFSELAHFILAVHETKLADLKKHIKNLTQGKGLIKRL